MRPVVSSMGGAFEVGREAAASGHGLEALIYDLCQVAIA